MKSPYLPFADWLKAIGLAVIVWGHVAARTTVTWTPPVYPKQLGVAFFVFVTGFTLAREQRSRALVVFNRFFEVCFFGLVFALLMSAAGVILWSDINESNYLPLVGLNVVIDDFPANPTTWYIGTYLHILLLWAFVLRRVRVKPWMLLAVCGLEIVIRAVLIETAGRHLAYMAVTNWLTVLMLGMAFGQKDASGERPAAGILLRAAPVMAIWPFAMMLIPWQLTFPFMSLNGSSASAGTLAVSVATSLVYGGFTVAAYAVTSRLPASAFVRFLARNSIVVFIAHMPVYYLLEYALRPLVPGYGPRVAIEFLVCLPGLSLLSEQVRRVVRPTVLRDRLAVRLQRLFGPEPLVSSN